MNEELEALMKEKYSLISPKLLIICSLVNLVLAGLFLIYFQSPWGWLQATYANSNSPSLIDALALIQLFWLAFTFDQIFRYFFDRFNSSIRSKSIPLVSAQIVTVVLYVLAALATYLLFFQYPLTSLVAASGAVTLGLGYLFKNLIQDMVISLQIQSDGLVAVNDWILLTTNHQPTTYQILDIDKRMVTLQQVDGYQELVRNSIFYDLRIINLSRQTHGSKRSVKLIVASVFSELKVTQVLVNVMDFLANRHNFISKKHDCRILEVEPTKTSFLVDYFCSPDKSELATNHLVREAALRFLKCAGLVHLGALDSDKSDTWHLQDYCGVQFIAMNRQQELFSRLFGVHAYSFLTALNIEELKQLSKNIELDCIEAGQKIINFGDDDDCLFVISEGVVEVTLSDSSTSTTHKISLWPGDCFGEMSLLTGEKRSADVVAIKDCSLIRIDKSSFAPLLESNLELADALAQSIVKRNQSVLNSQQDSQVFSEVKQSLIQRIYSFFKLVSISR